MPPARRSSSEWCSTTASYLCHSESECTPHRFRVFGANEFATGTNLIDIGAVACQPASSASKIEDKPTFPALAPAALQAPSQSQTGQPPPANSPPASCQRPPNQLFLTHFLHIDFGAG